MVSLSAYMMTPGDIEQDDPAIRIGRYRRSYDLRHRREVMLWEAIRDR